MGKQGEGVGGGGRALTLSYSHVQPEGFSGVLQFFWILFLITTVLQLRILPTLNHVFRLRVGGGMHVSVTMSVLPGILRYFNRRHLMSGALVEPDGLSISFPKSASGPAMATHGSR